MFVAIYSNVDEYGELTMRKVAQGATFDEVKAAVRALDELTELREAGYKVSDQLEGGFEPLVYVDDRESGDSMIQIFHL